MHPESLLVEDLNRSDICKYVFRALLGILFLLSATAKLVGIDAFELYLFSFQLFPLGLAYLLARLVIAAEFTVGILLIANFYPRTAFSCALALLAGFSVFLAVLAAAGNRDNCNCFGELVNLNPVQSLLKNAGMLALLLLSVRLPAFRMRHKPLWAALACAVPLACVLIVSPPDNWRYDAYARHALVNETAFREAVDSGMLPASVTDGEHVVCFFSLKCNYCKMSARKMTPLRARGEFSQAPVIVLFGRGTDTDAASFFAETGFQADEVHFIEPADFLRITNGAMPLILVMDGDRIAGQFNYRNLH